jgi:hypothetical protein
MLAVKGESQIIGSFIEWLGENGMAICHVTDDDDVPYTPEYGGIEKMLARYFDVDLNAAERERQAILDSLQKE